MNIPTIPDNSLTEEIKEIIRLCGLLEPRYGKNALRLNPPATEEEISAWEENNGISLPESYKDWLRFSNGSRILDDLMTTIELKNISVERDIVPDDLVILGTLIGDGELLCFSKETGRIVRFDHGNLHEMPTFRSVLLWTIEMMEMEF